MLRQTLLFGGLETIIYNINRKNFDLKLYEFGRSYHVDTNKPKIASGQEKYSETAHLSVFLTGKANSESWREPQKEVDFFDLKYFVFGILDKLGLNPDRFETKTLSNDLFENGIQFSANQRLVIEMGALTGKVLDHFDIKQKVYYADLNWDMVVDLLKDHSVSYREVPKYPKVRRDLALLVDKKITFEELKTLAFKTERNILKEVNLFDVYEGDKIEQGKKSYALSFILQDERKTLTDKVIDKTMRKLQNVFEREFHATIR